MKTSFMNLAQKYFTHPSYLKIEGLPVVHIYDTAGITSEIVTPIKQLREDIKDIGVDMFLVGQEIDWGEKINSARIKAFDAISAWGFPPTWVKNQPLPRSVIYNEYLRWQSAAMSVDVDLIPSTYPGYDDRNLGFRTVHKHIPKSPEFLSQNMSIAKEFLGNTRQLTIKTFNDWGEKTFIEPSKEERFKYLEVIKSILTT